MAQGLSARSRNARLILPRRRIDLLNLDLDLLAQLQDVAGVADAVPAELADVDQPIDAAQIDERAEFLQAADDPLAHLARLRARP